MWLKILAIPAHTQVSSVEVLVSYVPGTPEPEVMVGLAAWRGPGFRMAVSVTGSASAHHSSQEPSSHAGSKPRFSRESAVWLERPWRHNCSCAAFSQHSSVTALPSTWGDQAGEDLELAPHLPTLLPWCQINGSKQTHLHAPADSYLIVQVHVQIKSVIFNAFW